MSSVHLYTNIRQHVPGSGAQEVAAYFADLLEDKMTHRARVKGWGLRIAFSESVCVCVRFCGFFLAMSLTHS